MNASWTAEELLEAARGFQASCILTAAAELDVVGTLSEQPLDSTTLAEKLGTDARALAMLADALTALGILAKTDGRYSPAPGITELFDKESSSSVVAMLRHQANCSRSWAHLSEVVRSGAPYDRPASVRGEDEDRRSFIEAMEVASREAAPRVIASLGEIRSEHLLDIGGGPGTWTRAFLEAHPRLRATLYDLPPVLPIARRHLEKHGLLDRVDLVAGDFYRDESFPGGCDLAWISAITHQNSRAQNRELYAKVHAALQPDGRVLIRDIVMSEDHVAPSSGALFAINMLVNTPEGGTWSVAEQFEDLAAAGFRQAEVHEGERAMDWVISARKS